MNLLFDFFPIICFFIAFKFFDIYTATAVTIIASALQIGIFWLKNRRFEMTHLLTFAILLILGGATIISKNPWFIKWKPTAISWLMATAFFGSMFIGKKSLLEYMLDKKVALEKMIWNKLNWSWIIFLAMMGSINLYVAYNFSTNAWVNFKLFGFLGATLAFSIVQSLYISKYMQKQENL